MKPCNLLLFLLPLAILTGSAAVGAAKPNIVFIYADDWGWGDLACHGHPHLQTPNIDGMARAGTDFHHFTVANPVCSPSRTAILTGHFPARHGVHEHFAGHAENVARGMPDWLDPQAAVLPWALKKAGYALGHFGKWHLSSDGIKDAPWPEAYGFDKALVWTGPGRDVFTGSSYEDKAGPHGDPVASAYKSAAAVEHAIRFIRGVKGRPFYVNLWLQETHHLVAATEADRRAYPDTPEPFQTYFAAVTRADRLIGEVLATLDELGVANNTIVIFSSDNGPEDRGEKPEDKFYRSQGETGGLRGRKRSLYLGGVNTPFIVRWPGRVPAGRVDRSTVLSGVDVLPTLLAAVGVPVPAGYAGDGEEMLAAWEGRAQTRTKPLFWEWRGTHGKPANWPELAMRDGHWILLMTADRKRVELYDIGRDRAQEQNLAAAEPARVEAMTGALRAWKATLPAAPAGAPASGGKPVVKPAGGGGAPSVPGSAAGGGQELDRQEVFQRWDRNADGYLSQKEYTDGLTSKANAEARFRKFDRTSDGKISREEFLNPPN